MHEREVCLLVCRVHIRMLFVLDIPWDSVTLDPYVPRIQFVRTEMSLRTNTRCVLLDALIWWHFKVLDKYFKPSTVYSIKLYFTALLVSDFSFLQCYMLAIFKKVKL